MEPVDIINKLDTHFKFDERVRYVETEVGLLRSGLEDYIDHNTKDKGFIRNAINDNRREIEKFKGWLIVGLFGIIGCLIAFIMSGVTVTVAP